MVRLLDSAPESRPLVWVGSSQKDLRAMPKGIRADFGHELSLVQQGDVQPSARVLKGFGGTDVLELRADDAAGTYHAVYTVRFEEAVYVLHAFQKKATRGIATRQQDIALIKARLAAAQACHASHEGGAP